jgi:hypothetical protein
MYAARELAARGTLTLDAVVVGMSALAERPGFGQALDGHVRSAYPVLPSIVAAGAAWLLSMIGALDLEAPMTPTLVAKLTSSLLVALAAACAFLIARARTSAGLAALVALGFGFGTNVWLAGQTLGGHETVAFGLPAAVVLLAPPGPSAAGWRAWVALAAAGACCYPAERWNTSPDDVDARHERLWDWRDPQFVRCWKTGLSEQNFDLFRAFAPGAPDQPPFR